MSTSPPSAKVTFRPGPLEPALVAYCEKHALVPSDVIRQALALFLGVEADHTVKRGRPPGKATPAEKRPDHPLEIGQCVRLLNTYGAYGRIWKRDTRNRQYEIRWNWDGHKHYHNFDDVRPVSPDEAEAPEKPINVGDRVVSRGQYNAIRGSVTDRRTTRGGRVECFVVWDDKEFRGKWIHPKHLVHVLR